MEEESKSMKLNLPQLTKQLSEKLLFEASEENLMNWNVVDNWDCGLKKVVKRHNNKFWINFF